MWGSQYSIGMMLLVLYGGVQTHVAVVWCGLELLVVLRSWTAELSRTMFHGSAVPDQIY